MITLKKIQIPICSQFRREFHICRHLLLLLLLHFLWLTSCIVHMYTFYCTLCSMQCIYGTRGTKNVIIMVSATFETHIPHIQLIKIPKTVLGKSQKAKSVFVCRLEICICSVWCIECQTIFTFMENVILKISNNISSENNYNFQLNSLWWIMDIGKTKPI